MKMDILQKLKRYRKKIWLFFLLTVFLCGACRAAYVTGARSGHVTIRELDSLQLEDCTKLMVVAHPDDETLWGGAHLLDGKYFVVCLTDGYNKVRRQEFLNAIKESGNKGLILRYPDKVRGERSKWVGDKKDIIKDLDTILTYKHWNMVATHNPEGEYGHIHHQMTSQLVTQEYYRNYQINLESTIKRKFFWILRIRFREYRQRVNQLKENCCLTINLRKKLKICLPI